MAINIKKVVDTNFIVKQTQVPIGSYKAVLYVTNSDTDTAATTMFAALGGSENSKYFRILNITGVSDIGAAILAQKKAVSGTESDFVFVVFNPIINDSILGNKANYNPENPSVLPTVLAQIHVRRLREKIEPNPAEPIYIMTKWGVGYYFNEE